MERNSKACRDTDLPQALRRASELLDEQLKEIERLLEEGGGETLSEPRLAALLEAQTEDTERRTELLIRTTRLLEALCRPKQAGTRSPAARQRRSAGRESSQSCYGLRGRSA